MCHLLYTLSLQTGALALVREISAQNFATPTAPPGYEGEFEFVSSDHACISPSPARKNWHNEVLWDEATSWNLSTVPFYESTLFWGSVLFKKRTQNGLDCTHEICYTPAYYGPLCSAVTQLVLENASLITFSTFRRRRRSRKPVSFHAGGARKKRWLVSRKSVKGCARPALPRKAQPRRAALTLQLS